MRILSLELHNIGPFEDTEIKFQNANDELKNRPEVIITGENGTGKSIVIDAIRGLLSSYPIERDIVANHTDFKIRLLIESDKKELMLFESTQFVPGNKNHFFTQIEAASSQRSDRDNLFFFADYWGPNISTDTFNIPHLSPVKTDIKMKDLMEQMVQNSAINSFICYIDYLRGSEDHTEQELGEHIYRLISDIISDCIGEGRFASVSRKHLMPQVVVYGKQITIEKLSLGNQLLLTHLVRTLYKMYCFCEKKGIKLEELNKISGILLIDEVENHLHPKWQKRVVGLIHKYFPNLQLIMTTHSPFVVSSVESPKVFVCKSGGDYTTIVDVSSNYANFPVDEVLGMDVFDVDPFSNKISRLLQKRKQAIHQNDKEEKEKIESELVNLNQSFFYVMRHKEFFGEE